MPGMMHAADVVEVINTLELAGVDVWVYGGWEKVKHTYLFCLRKGD